MAMQSDTKRMTEVLAGSIVAALVIQIIGDTFSEQLGSTANGVVDVAPAIVVALGLYGAFQYM